MGASCPFGVMTKVEDYPEQSMCRSAWKGKRGRRYRETPKQEVTVAIPGGATAGDEKLEKTIAIFSEVGVNLDAFGGLVLLNPRYEVERCLTKKYPNCEKVTEENFLDTLLEKANTFDYAVISKGSPNAKESSSIISWLGDTKKSALAYDPTSRTIWLRLRKLHKTMSPPAPPLHAPMVDSLAAVLHTSPTPVKVI
eukprot:TRINITY_DN20810_c0_g1_i1.p1 TRINITY_DN20810_c0_g1~~TRINITY_DN20810_c0_g1_i1.p1  ORF type:complete len:196 (+),score=33.82 TRINITY_DN20810_c0_g1_i1:201-788(+)